MENDEKKRFKIVIVDDDDDLLKLMIYLFEAQEFDVISLSSGKEALAYFSDEAKIKSIDLLILDRMLPDLDGLEILKKLEKMYPKKTPIVLFLSVLGAEKDVLKGLEAGAVDYLTKPFNLDVLLDKARSLLTRYRK